MEDTPEHKALVEAIRKAGSQADLGKAVGVTQQAVSDWLRKSRRVTAEYVLKVEKATGVSRHDLRGDIYPREEQAAD